MWRAHPNKLRFVAIYFYDWSQRFPGSVRITLQEALPLNVKYLYDLILHIFLHRKGTKFATTVLCGCSNIDNLIIG